MGATAAAAARSGEGLKAPFLPNGPQFTIGPLPGIAPGAAAGRRSGPNCGGNDGYFLLGDDPP
jgi:hypothetical protein